MGSAPDNGMKETELGMLPEDWEVASFGERVDVKSGQVDPRDQPYSEMIHVGPENIQEASGRLFPCKTAEELKLRSSKYLFTPDDVIYSKIRPHLRKAVLPEFEGTCSLDMYPLRPANGSLCRDFLYFWLLSDSFTKQSVSYQSRTRIPKINRQQLGSTLMPVPPLPEQQAIVHVLRTVQRTKEATEKVIAVTRMLKQSLMRHLFTYGPVPFDQADQVELKETEVGENPSEWNLQAIGDVCDVLDGHAFKSTDYVEQGTLSFRIVNIESDGRLNIGSGVKYLPDSFREEYAKYLLNDQDILLVMAGTTRGKIGFVTAAVLPTLMNQNMWRILSTNQEIVMQRYVYHYLVHIIPVFAKRYSEAGGFFSKTHFRSFPLMLPPTCGEQKRIVECLDAVEDSLDTYEDRRGVLDRLFQSLLHNLMTGNWPCSDG